MAYLHKINKGTRADGTTYKTIIVSDQPVGATPITIGSQTVNMGNGANARYGIYSPKTDNGAPMNADNPFWATFEQEHKPGDEIPALVVGDTNFTFSDGTISDNLFYCKA
tara:strand:- start:9029 stop:9358 length:330 start_codon:yes stop_codon:yes gene_type:complete